MCSSSSQKGKLPKYILLTINILISDKIYFLIEYIEKTSPISIMGSKIFALLLLFYVSLSGADDVIGCGGFIKASRVLDFSRINVQLFSKAGSLKFETECAPNNGYFFIPVYEHGTYSIKVAPPLGWKFSPSEVVVNIDGVNDECSTNKDINFNFDGFGVVGRVITAGTDSGPSGVSISLKSGNLQAKLVLWNYTFDVKKIIDISLDDADAYAIHIMHGENQLYKNSGHNFLLQPLVILLEFMW